MKNNSLRPNSKFDINIAEDLIRFNLVKRLLDWVLLLELKETPNLNGYELIMKEKRRFGKPISPGIVYCILLRLEQKGLIKPKIHGGNTAYELTDEGHKILSAFKTSCKRMIPGLMNLLEIVDDSE